MINFRSNRQKIRSKKFEALHHWNVINSKTSSFRTNPTAVLAFVELIFKFSWLLNLALNDAGKGLRFSGRIIT